MTIDLDVAIRLLRLLTPMAASLALSTVAVGLVTSHWLYSEEKMPNPKFNRTGDPELEFLSKFTTSGLWDLCYINPGETERYCFNIDYFPKEEYSPDPNDSTLSIPYAVLRSCPFFFLAAGLLVVAEVTCFIGHFVPKRRYCTFLSGVTFILSGLLLLLGLVVYVSVFTAEIGSKLRPSSSLQPPMFTYTYGYSFQLVVTGFLAAEVAGTWAIFLFIYWHRNRIAKKEMHRKMALALVQTPVLELNVVHHDQQTLVQQQQPNAPASMMMPNQQHQFYGNGFILPCSCSSPNAGHTDDDIPTPPPAAIYNNIKHSNDGSSICPVHQHCVTVHAGSIPPTTGMSNNVNTINKNFRRPPSIRRQAPIRDTSIMPDITAFGNTSCGKHPLHPQHQRRQISSESDNSASGVQHHHHHHNINSHIIPQQQSAVSRGQQQQQQHHFQQQICYQCHGAGHVAVTPSSSMFNSVRPMYTSSSSLPRDMTSSTVVTLDLDDAGSQSTQQQHQEVDDDHQLPRRPHSSTSTAHYGSLRRITAV